MVSNFQQVKNWMRSVGQATPESPVVIDKETAVLRYTLVAEETQELLEAIEEYELGVEEGNLIEAEQIALLKEGADVLVVVYGMFVAMGIDADLVHTLVMQNNERKVASAITRDDGKIVVPKEVKEQLKAQITESLAEVLKG